MRLIGYVRCRECSKWTERSIVAGNICSTKCLMEEIERKNK